jgi:transcriptional regulator of met regulon
MEVYLRKE